MAIDDKENNMYEFNKLNTNHSKRQQPSIIPSAAPQQETITYKNTKGSDFDEVLSNHSNQQ